MSQVFKRPGSPFYYARFQLAGQDYCLSTKKKKLKDARERMRELIAERKGSVSARELLTKLAASVAELPADEQKLLRREIVATFQDERCESLLLEKAWAAWLKDPRKRDPGPRTIDGYQRMWKKFLAWSEKRKLEHMHDVTPAVAEKYATHIWEEKIAPGTYNHHIGFLRSIFKVLRTQSGMTANPWMEIPNMDRVFESRRSFTSDELEIVCSKATGSLRHMIGLGLYTGMRLADCVNLPWSAVDFEANRIVHVPAKTKRKGTPVRIPIHPILVHLLVELRQSSKGEFLFPEERRLYDRDSGAVSKRIQSFFEDDCGIKTAEEVGDRHRKNAVVRVGFHSLRHSFVSLCAAKGVPQVAIMDLDDHGSPAMTALYSHTGDEQKSQAIAALPEMAFSAEGDVHEGA